MGNRKRITTTLIKPRVDLTRDQWLDLRSDFRQLAAHARPNRLTTDVLDPLASKYHVTIGTIRHNTADLRKAMGHSAADYSLELSAGHARAERERGTYTPGSENEATGSDAGLDLARTVLRDDERDVPRPKGPGRPVGSMNPLETRIGSFRDAMRTYHVSSITINVESGEYEVTYEAPRKGKLTS